MEKGGWASLFLLLHLRLLEVFSSVLASARQGETTNCYLMRPKRMAEDTAPAEEFTWSFW